MGYSNKETIIESYSSSASRIKLPRGPFNRGLRTHRHEAQTAFLTVVKSNVIETYSL
jgi:hypothetical protein